VGSSAPISSSCAVAVAVEQSPCHDHRNTAVVAAAAAGDVGDIADVADYDL